VQQQQQQQRCHISRRTSRLLPSLLAPSKSSAQCLAMPVSRGSSGFGADNSAWMLSSTVRICSAGDHLSCQVQGAGSHDDRADVMRLQ
jgi:hypothetical protein